MICIGSNSSGKLTICSELPVTSSQCNKLNNEINEKRIKNWLKDNNCTTHCLDETKQVKKSNLWCERSIVNEGDLSKFTELHKSFLEFVDSLPEVDAMVHALNLDLVHKKECEFITDILDSLQKKEISCGVLITELGPIGIPCGHISPETLIEMCECYLEKYGNKNGQSAESTAS